LTRFEKRGATTPKELKKKKKRKTAIHVVLLETTIEKKGALKA